MGFYLLIGGGIIVLVALFTALSYMTAAKRSRAWQELAQRMGGTFLKDAPESIKSRLALFSLFSHPAKYSSYSNMIHAPRDGDEVAVFDYHATVATDPGLFDDKERSRPDKRYAYTALYFRSNKLKLPRFILTKQGFLGGVATSFGLQKDIDFASHTDFSLHFRLGGGDEPSIRRLFDEPMLSYFEKNRECSVEGLGEEMIVYSDKLRTEEIQPFVTKGFEVFKLFSN